MTAPTTFELALPWSKPPLNLNDRPNYYAKARMVKEIRKAAWVTAKQAKVGHHERVSVTLHYQPARRGRRDSENLHGTGKPVYDGLVDAGLVDDDDTVHMVKPEPVIHDPVRGEPGRLWLEIEVLA